ncbi:MAG: hypothetical protein PVSMB9_05330 [Candidatus Dormibacteria bacterium]
MNTEFERLDPEVLLDVAADMRGELDRIQEQMAELIRLNKRALALKAIYGNDPLTRERFNLLHDHVDQFAGKMAELREDERLLTRWLDRCGELLRTHRQAA